MRISDWSSDVCSSDLRHLHQAGAVDAAMPTPAPDIGLAQITLRHRDPVAFQRVDRRSMALVHIARSEEHTSELQSLMRISYAVFCLQKRPQTNHPTPTHSLHQITYPYVNRTHPDLTQRI